VDFVVTNGSDMHLRGDTVISLRDENQKKSVTDFRGQKVHAIAGIGHPERFFTSLREQQIDIIPHIFPDHYQYQQQDIDFPDELPILMTEKDAVKCDRFANEKHWYLPVVAEVNPELNIKF
jgi:tetraacyldisaccharide 4'-kinase